MVQTIFIDPNTGNLGIGTTVANYQLQVNGNTYVNGLTTTTQFKSPGTIIQTVYSSNITELSTNSTSYVSTGLIGSITPKFADSTLVVVVNLPCAMTCSVEEPTFYGFVKITVDNNNTNNYISLPDYNDINDGGNMGFSSSVTTGSYALNGASMASILTCTGRYNVTSILQHNFRAEVKRTGDNATITINSPIKYSSMVIYEIAT